MLDQAKQEAAIVLEPFNQEDESKISEAEEDLHLSDADQLLETLDHDSDEEEQILNFDTLKAKTTAKQFGKTPTPVMLEPPKPKVIERVEVIDDWIRNFLNKLGLTQTLISFQTEWNELQKKGIFQDKAIGLNTDIESKNAKLEKKVSQLNQELSEQQIVANKAKQEQLKSKVNVGVAAQGERLPQDEPGES